jgi:signal transduction histidine kinase
MAFEEINQRYQASKQAYQELAQVQQLKDDFLSMMSHEMRTPLTILLLTAQSLLRKLEHSQEEGPVAFHERVKESLVTIQQQGQQLQVLLADLLDAARLQGDMFRLSLCSMDLVKLVQESIIQQELLTTRRVKLICALETMVGIWDKTRLKQVIHNLLTNALKYSEASTEVVITLRYHFISKHAQEILISVQDHGRGIDKEDLPHIFKQFYRAKKQPDADYQANVSLGLGLSICAEIMKRHGGRIWVESCSGEGSTFFAILPLREPAKGSLSS